MSLLGALQLEGARCISLIGAGGKTTTMLALGDELTRRGESVLVTTTTKIWPPEGMPLVLLRDVEDPIRSLRDAIGVGSSIAIGRHIGDEAKLHGLPPDLLCSVHESRVADVILCEADGAAGRSLKAHREGEPVIPACSDVALILAGLDAVGAALNETVAHRVELLSSLLRVQTGEPIKAAHMAAAIQAMAATVPPGMSTRVVLNKADTSERVRAGREVTAALGALLPDAPVLLTARGLYIP